MSSFASFSIAKALSAFSIEISDVVSNKMVNDSRQVDCNAVFCAVIGTQQDGRDYIEKAVDAGAAIVVAQCLCESHHGNVISRSGPNGDVPIIQFYELDKHLYALAKTYYGDPERQLKLIGITGTNGKTSTSQMLAKCLELLGKKSAVIGTIGAGQLDALTPIANTTPGPTELNGLLAQFVSKQVTDVAMEVSSHALSQHRVNPAMFDIALFTNLSRDHLDYHETMEEYAKAKFSLFTGEKTQTAVINLDDEYGRQWLSDNTSEQRVIKFSRLKQNEGLENTLAATNIKHGLAGTAFLLSYGQQNADVQTPLLGDFNIENLLAVAAGLIAYGFGLDEIANVLGSVDAPAGRMESFTSAKLPTSVVDYAHTPDALENALVACRQHCQGQLWVVFGCGGDRDKGKRSLMGKVSEKLADKIVITNDNPRSEAPELIANDILTGINQPEKTMVMLDRAQAVRWCMTHALPEDIVLYAGKGHENNIIIADQVLPYNERAMIKSFYHSEVSA